MGVITKALSKVKWINDSGQYEDVVQRYLSLYGSSTGIAVTEQTALSVPAIYNCIRIISEDVAKLPLHLFKASKENRDRMTGDSLYRLLHDAPNPLMTAQEYRETCTSHILLRGNSYSHIVWKGNKPVELWPLRPDKMQVILKTNGEGYEIKYKYTKNEGTSYEFPENEILHLRGLSSDGIMGYSPITVFADPIGLTKAQEMFAGRFFRNNATPDMVLKHPGKLGPVAYQRLKDSWKEGNEGLENAHGFDILEEGMDIVKIGLSNEDSQFIESREFSISEVCRMFRMQPHKLFAMKQPTYASVEMFAIEYVVDTLQPWLERWEQRLNLQLLGEKRIADGWYFEHDVNGLLRGDTKARFEAYNMGRNGGWLSRNDIRKFENMNPIENGDDYLTPVNMQPLNATPAGV